jgi:TolA-binding protein
MKRAMTMRHRALGIAIIAAAWLGAVAPGAESPDQLIGQGRFAEAAGLLGEAVKAAGGTERAALQVKWIEALTAAGKLVSANAACAEALKDAPDHPARSKLQFLSAQLKEANGQLTEALSLYRSLAEQQPPVAERQPALLGAIRVAGQDLRDGKEAARSMEDFVKAFPADPQAREMLLGLYGFHFWDGAGDRQKGVEFARAYRAAFPQDPGVSLLQEFFLLHHLGDKAGALAAWDRDLASPQFVLNATAMDRTWNVLTSSVDYAERLDRFVTDYFARSGDAEWLARVMDHFVNNNLCDRAQRLAKTLIDTYPGTGMARRGRLAMAEALRRAAAGKAGPKAAEAEKLLLAIIQEEPVNFEAWQRYGWLLGEQKRVPEYVKAVTQAIAGADAQTNPAARGAIRARLTLILARTAVEQKDWPGAWRAINAFLLQDGSAFDEGRDLLNWAGDCAFNQAVGFDVVAAALEKFLLRCPPWTAPHQRLNELIQWWGQSHPAEAKRLVDLLARVKADENQKLLAAFWEVRCRNQWPEAAAAAAPLWAKLAGSPRLELESSWALLEAQRNAGQGVEAVAAAKRLLDLYPGDSGLIWQMAMACERLAAPRNQECLKWYEELAKLGCWPADPLAVFGAQFNYHDGSRSLSGMAAACKQMATVCPWRMELMEYQRRLACKYAEEKQPDEALKLLLALVARAKPCNEDLRYLFEITGRVPNPWPTVLPLAEDFLARPNRGPAQAGALCLKGWARLGDQDAAGAAAILHEMAQRPADGPLSGVPQSSWWAEAMVNPLLEPKNLKDLKPEHLPLIRDAATVYPWPLAWNHARAAGLVGQPLEFAWALNRFTVNLNPNDGGWFGNYMELSRLLAEAGRDELAAVVLKLALARFTGVDAKLLAQAQQALLSLGKGFTQAEETPIDDQLPWAVLLKAARQLRAGDPEPAWKTYLENVELFDRNLDKLPVDYLRFVAAQLLGRGQEALQDRAEKMLRRWLIMNEKVTLIAEEEKAKTQYQLADTYYLTQRYDLARSEFQSVANRYPKLPQALDAQFRIGECYMQQKMYGDATKLFEKLAKVRDKDATSRAEFMLGVLAQQKGDADEAKRRFKAVMEMTPSKDVADALLFRLSGLYGAESRYREALLLLRTMGVFGSADKKWHAPGTPLSIVIQDSDLGVSRGGSYVPVVVSTSGGDRETVRLESGAAGKGLFRADLPTALGDPKPGDGKLQLNGADVITYDYPEDFKREFTAIARPQAAIRIAANAELAMSATEIRDEAELDLARRLRDEQRRQRQGPGHVEYRAGTELKPGNNIYLQVKDLDRDVSARPDTVRVLVESSSGGRVGATLIETGPHTGLFRATLKTLERQAGAMASDASQDNPAAYAIDGDPRTAWEGQNDGRAPKSLTIDLKQAARLGAITWTADANYRDKIPTAYRVQVSNDLKEWTTIAATEGLKDAPPGKIKPATGKDGVPMATIAADGTSARYVRLLIEKFNGSAPRLAEVAVADPNGKALLPLPGAAAAADVLALSPGDRVSATYEDEFNLVSPGKPRTLSQRIQATYYNARVSFIGYLMVEVPGNRIPVQFTKRVRRALPGQRVVAQIIDYDADVSDQRDQIACAIKLPGQADAKLAATETERFTGVFTKEFDLAGPAQPQGLKLAPGETLELSYLDEQNTVPGYPVARTAQLQAVQPAEPRVRIIETTVTRTKDQDEHFEFLPSTAVKPTDGIKLVAFRPPLTFEIIDPSAARDSFSEVTATVTTSGGSSAEVICPLASAFGGEQHETDAEVGGLEQGRFVGQIIMNLGDKGSPATTVLEPGDPRTLIQRRTPAAKEVIANVVPVLNINGQDLITVTYRGGVVDRQAAPREVRDQARLVAAAQVDVTDSAYEVPLKQLHVGGKVFVRVQDLVADATPGRDAVAVTLTTSRGETFAGRLQETLGHSGVFTGSFLIVPGEKPTPGDDRLEGWFGDTLKVGYAPKAAVGTVAALVTAEAGIVKGSDGRLLAFGKKLGDENIAIESQFRMAEAYFEMFKNYRSLKQQAQADTALAEGMQILTELANDHPSKAYAARIDYLLGQFAQELKQFNQAIAYYKNILQNFPEHRLAPDAQYKLGQCYEDIHDMDAACAEYVTLAYSYPDSPLVANVIVRIADYFFEKKDYQTAAEVSRKFVERFPAHEWAERLAFRAGQCFYKAEQFRRAGEEFDALAQNYPRGKLRADAIFWAGESYRGANDRRLAYRRYKQVTWDYPESEAARFARGRLVLPDMAEIGDETQP